jgi:hypothetical protein
VDEFVHVEPKREEYPRIIPRKSVRGSGKERLDTWKEEAKHVYKNTVMGKLKS